MQKSLDDKHKDMKLQIQGLVPPGQQRHRNPKPSHRTQTPLPVNVTESAD
jgi:hypothetical protein